MRTHPPEKAEKNKAQYLYRPPRIQVDIQHKIQTARKASEEREADAETAGTNSVRNVDRWTGTADDQCQP
jgi:hypothetical protein